MSNPPVQYFNPRPGQKTAYRVYNPKHTSSTGKTPLVLVQGMSAVGTVDWHDLASVLSRSRTIVTLDNRDIGESTLEDVQPFSLLDLGMDVVDLVTYLGYKEIDILGHSMGGMIVQTLLTTPNLPIKIRHAVLGATSPRGPRSDLGKAVHEQMQKVKREAGSDTRPKAVKDRELTVIFMKYCYDENWIKENPELYEKRIQESLKTRRPARTVALQQRAIGGYDVRKQLHTIPSSLPVLVIHGSQDVAVYPDSRDEILAGIKHASDAKCPRGDFAHNWYDYFGTDFWVKTLSDFLDRSTSAKL